MNWTSNFKTAQYFLGFPDKIELRDAPRCHFQFFAWCSEIHEPGSKDCNSKKEERLIRRKQRWYVYNILTISGTRFIWLEINVTEYLITLSDKGRALRYTGQCYWILKNRWILEEKRNLYEGEGEMVYSAPVPGISVTMPRCHSNFNWQGRFKC